MRPFRPRLEALEERCVPATFTVKNLNDAGPGSLRAAIEASNLNDNNPITDKIVFKSTLKGTITLASQLDIQGNLIIDGLGASRLTINGAGQRIFRVDDLLGSQSQLTIRKLTLTGGGGVGAGVNDGGAIFSRENLTLEQVKLTGNQVAGSNDGGAVAAVGGDLTLRQCTLQNNSTRNGGGVYFESTGVLTVTGSTFTSNTAAFGGALLVNQAGNVSISSSTFTRNRALASGGAMMLSECAILTISNTRVTSNSAFDGGGLKIIDAPSAQIVQCTIASNSAGTGGGLFITGVLITDLVLQASTVSDNFADGAGGGLHIAGGDVKVIACTLAFNFANQEGGGIYVDGADVDLGVHHSTISTNFGDAGGGLALLAGNSAFIANSTIAFNACNSDGGGIFAQFAVELMSTIVAHNRDLGQADDLFSVDPVSDPFELHFSLIGTDPGPAAGILNAGSNLLGTDPRLGALKNNGGPTLTHALLAGSPALNVSDEVLILNPINFPTDQRGAGFKRVKGGAIDIGAFER